jgi:hypothetical protein
MKRKLTHLIVPCSCSCSYSSFCFSCPFLLLDVGCCSIGFVLVFIKIVVNVEACLVAIMAFIIAIGLVFVVVTMEHQCFISWLGVVTFEWWHFLGPFSLIESLRWQGPFLLNLHHHRHSPHQLRGHQHHHHLHRDLLLLLIQFLPSSFYLP